MKHLVLALVCLVSVNAVSILTQNADNARTGWNSKETTITPQNVAQLQLLGTMQTAAPCTTQILYYEDINIDGHKNVIFCWTNADQNNGNSTVYAFDADSFAPVWALYIGQSAIWSTHAPAIDEATKYLYFIYKNNDDNGYNYIIGIDIMTGKMIPDSPKFINASVAGTGDANENGRVFFQNTQPIGSGRRIHQNSRTSMLILNSVLFFGFAHNSDSFPYHGWIFSYRYDIANRQFVQLAFFCTTPNAGLGGVWQSGQGLATDGTSIYFTTGNGDFNPGKDSYSMAVIKMSLQLTVEDYFVPQNWKGYSNADLDVGNCGPALIPGSHYVVVATTKYGAAHLMDTNNMGKFNAGKDSCRQTVSVHNGFVAPGGNPVVWNTGKISKIYTWGPGAVLAQLNFDSGSEMIQNPFPSWGTNSGGGLFITSNGVNDGLLWAYGNGHIYAFDASKDVSAGPIWNAGTRGSASFGFPMVANGRVFLPGADSRISVYGHK